MRNNLILLMFISIIMVMVACGDSTESNTEAESNEEAPVEDTEEGATIKIGVLASLTGALESYGKQTKQGFEIGLDYATDGTMEVAGKTIEVVFEDTETKPEVAVQKATKLLEDDEVDFLVGSSSSGDTLAVLPLAEEYEKIMVVEPAVADSITGEEFNPYIFRTGRNSSQDAVAGAAAIAEPGVTIATFAPDYSFGWDGIAAFKDAAEELGAEVILEEFADPDATDFTSNLQKIIEADPDYLYVVWAGANTPWNQIEDLKIQDKGIQISTGVADLATLPTMTALVGMEGFTVYHHSLPDNEVNDWLIQEHEKRFDDVPDLFTPGGMTAALAIVEALKNSDGNADGDTLIKVMEGMSFDSPKGPMIFREEDHQALQPLYSVTLEEHDGIDHPVPVLIRELSLEETAPPIMNK